jgi:hypothetical protein
MPYWDPSDQASTDAWFADDFMGGNGKKEDNYHINSGPLAGEDKFPIRVSALPFEIGKGLRRCWGNGVNMCILKSEDAAFDGRNYVLDTFENHKDNLNTKEAIADFMHFPEGAPPNPEERLSGTPVETKCRWDQNECLRKFNTDKGILTCEHLATTLDKASGRKCLEIKDLTPPNQKEYKVVYESKVW